MEEKHQDFYIKIRRQINSYLESKNFKHADILLLAPDFFHLLVKLTLDDRVPNDRKLKLGVGIAYFIMPFDFFPEAILGPLGYMDDVAVAAYILNDFINKTDLDVVYDNWAGDGDVLASIQNVLAVADSFLGEGLWNRIKNKINKE